MQHVDEVLAMASTEIAAKLMPQGFGVVAVKDAPNTMEDAIAAYKNTGKIVVSNYMSRDRLFGTPECNQSFDAWHDFCHVMLRATFDIPGEMKVDAMQQAHLMEWWKNSTNPVTEASIVRAREVLSINNVGRLQFWKAYNAPPESLRAFTEGYLTAKGLAEVPVHCHRRGLLLNSSAGSNFFNEWTEYL